MAREAIVDAVVWEAYVVGAANSAPGMALRLLYWPRPFLDFLAIVAVEYSRCQVRF